MNLSLQLPSNDGTLARYTLSGRRAWTAPAAPRFDRIESVVVPTIQRLLGFFRAHRLRIVHLTVGSELPDFSDLPPHMRPMAEAVGNTRGRRGSPRPP